jgi:hypothetical protein
MTALNPSPGAGEPVPPSVPPENPPAVAATAPASASRLSRWGLILVLGLLAGLAAWLVGERTYNFARPSLAASENYRDSTALNKEMPRVCAINGALSFGALGGLLGLAMGLAGGLVGGSPVRAAIAALIGLILGVAAGALPSLVLMPWYWEHRGDDPATLDLMVPLMLHLGLWSGAGLAAGLAYGIGSCGDRKVRIIQAALGGLIGALVGICFFEVVAAILLPFDYTANPFAETSRARFFARVAVTLFVALGVLNAYPRPRRRKAEARPQLA